MKMKKQLLITILLTLALSINAQVRESGLFINAGGGCNTLSYSLTNGSHDAGAGFILNGGYSYFFGSNLGVSAGIGVQSVTSTATMNYTSYEASVDYENDPYEFRVLFSGWKEKQNAILLEIPAGINYLIPLNAKSVILTSVGGKISFPLSATYKVTDGGLTTSGYYQQWDLLFTDMPQHGFSTYRERYSGDIRLKTSFSLFADIGTLTDLLGNNSLYVGCWLNYGLTNMIDESNDNVYLPDASYNSVLASNQTGKVTLLSFGLKIGLHL